MSQTLKTLINTVAAEVYDLQDTKADRVELNGYVRTVQSDANDANNLITLNKTGNVLSLNTENLRATLQQIVASDVTLIDLANYINSVVTDNEDLEHYLRLTSDGHVLHLDYSKLLTLIENKTISSLGDNNTGGYNLMYNRTIKAVKPQGYIQLSTDVSNLYISTNSSLNTTLAAKANAADLPDMRYYVGVITVTSNNAIPDTRLIQFTYRKGSDNPPLQIRPAATLEINMTLLETAMDTKAPINNPTFTGTVSGITKAMVAGLGNVDNTSDANKPISALTQAALDTLSLIHI